MGWLRACIGGRDPDDIFGYYTLKMVKVRDRRLGLLKYFFYFVIFIYVVVVQLLKNQAYLFRAAPIGTVRFSMRIPANSNCGSEFKVRESCSMFDPAANSARFGGGGGNNNCCSKIPPTSELQYCHAFKGQTSLPGTNRLPCILWDAISAKKAEQDSLLITTHVGIQRGQTVVAVPSGDPPPPANPTQIWMNHMPMAKYFIAGVEDFTINIEHTIFAETEQREHQFTRPQMRGGRLLVGGDNEAFKDVAGLCKRKYATTDNEGKVPNTSGKAPCYILPDSWDEECDKGCRDGTICNSDLNLKGSPDDQNPEVQRLRSCFFDIFKLGTLLNSGNIELDTPNLCAVGSCLADGQKGAPTTRQSGSVVNIQVIYTNFQPFSAGVFDKALYHYNVSQAVGSDYEETASQEQLCYDDGSGACDCPTGRGTSCLLRNVYQKSGIYLRYIATGWIGDASFTNTLITITTALTLIFTSQKITDFLAIYVVKEKSLYRAAMIEETESFKEIRQDLKEGIRSQSQVVMDLQTHVNAPHMEEEDDGIVLEHATSMGMSMSSRPIRTPKQAKRASMANVSAVKALSTEIIPRLATPGGSGRRRRSTDPAGRAGAAAVADAPFTSSFSGVHERWPDKVTDKSGTTWKKEKDPVSNRPYYFDRKSGRSQWTVPESADGADEQKKKRSSRRSMPNLTSL